MDNKYFFPWCVQNKKKHHTLEEANNIFIEIDGCKCYDMSSQAINVNIGHNNKNIIQAIKNQCDKLTFVSSSFNNSIKDEAANEILSVCPKTMRKVYFTSSGAEANENAIKISRMYTSKTKILSAYNSYHGSTFGAGNLTGDARRFVCENTLGGFVKFEYPNKNKVLYNYSSESELSNIYLNNLENIIINENPQDIAAIFIEPIIGGNGVIIPPKGYLKGIRKLCDKYNILMVCDEVMTGWGRTGAWFCIDHDSVLPDIITTSKGITSSYIAFGAVIVNNKISKYFDDNFFSCGSTNYGHLLGCAATVACIKEYKRKNLIENSKKLGFELEEILKKMKEKYSFISDVRCKGLFGCIEFSDTVKVNELISDLISSGFYTLGRVNFIMIAPPLIINEDELKSAMNILDNVLSNICI